MDWPIYKRELLALGNPASCTGLCTLWTEKEKILEHVSKDNYLIAGQCYGNSEGISLIVRHCLANKQIRQIVLCGVDLNHAGDALLALKERGLDSERKIIGFEIRIEEGIPIESIEKFRENVEIIDKRGIENLADLNSFLESLPKKETWGEAETFERAAPIRPGVCPSERTGFIIRGKTVGEAWIKILDVILRFGHIKKSEYSDDQQEIVNLISIVTEEDPDNIDWKEYFNFTKEHFQEYLPQLMDSKIEGSVSYTYGSRMRNFQGIDQIAAIVEKLKEAKYSRRAVAVTWDVKQDCFSKHNPCLNIVQALIQDRLYLTAYIRSNDMFRAWPENALALRKLQYEIAKKVGVPVGELVIISNSAHIYSPNWQEAREVVEKHLKEEREQDSRGNILVEIEDKKIKVTHLTPSGERVGEFYADNATEAYKKILKEKMISQESHALDIGVELGKAETALGLDLRYVQDRQVLGEEKRGLFIVFDGIDGCGKSTALWNFARQLAKRDKHIHLLVTREPYKKREIREILRSESNPYSQKEKLARLFVEDRKEHILELIFPSIKSGVNVISDRYKYATLAYQSSQGLELDKLIQMHVNLIVPDIVFVIDLPAEIAAQRMKTDVRAKEHKFEANLEFLENVRQAYLKLPEILPDENIKIIDGSKSIEEVSKQIIDIFDKFSLPGTKQARI